MDKEEAIKILKNFHDKSALFSVRTALETLHPELKESEDEKVKNKLIEFFKGYSPDEKWWGNITQEDILAWLEKQGQHKRFRDAIQVGDKVTKNEYDELVNLSQLNRVAKQGQQKLPIEKLPEEMKTIGESLGFTTQEECDEYNQMVSDIIMSDDDKVELKFKVGDWVINSSWKNSRPIKIISISSTKGYELIGNENDDKAFFLSKSIVETEYHLWTIRDAKDGDVIQLGEVTAIFQKYIDNGNCKCYCSIYNGEFEIPSQNGIDNTYGCHNAIPATKEQYDLLFQKMKEAGYEWDSEKKKLKKIELSDVGHEYYSELLKNDTSDNIADYAYQCVYCMSHDWAIENPTWDNVQSACRLGAKWQKKHDVSEDWSEEDEKMIGRVRGIIEAYAFSQSAVDVNGDLCEKKFIDVDIWLKSIKDRVKSQNTWKPSGEQMEVLAWCKPLFADPKLKGILESLIEDLKKLREE